MVELERLLQIYEQNIRNLDESADADEQVQDVLTVLASRHGFERVALTPEQQQRLDRLDEELIKRRQILAEWLPFPSPHERRHWWWFLHEGPQVREQAKVAAGARP